VVETVDRDVDERERKGGKVEGHTRRREEGKRKKKERLPLYHHHFSLPAHSGDGSKKVPSIRG